MRCYDAHCGVARLLERPHIAVQAERFYGAPREETVHLLFSDCSRTVTMQLGSGTGEMGGLGLAHDRRRVEYELLGRVTESRRTRLAADQFPICAILALK